MAMLVECVLGLLLLLPPVGWLLWRWNEMCYAAPVMARCLHSLPPGHLGLPFLGEILTFIWYFNILRSPDDFINSKRRKYGDNVGAYRTHLFGSPSIIACSPSLCKFVLQSTDKFKAESPTAEVQGSNSVITLEGARHAQIKSLIVPFINRPDSLATFTLQIQPTVIAALQSWSEMGNFKAVDEIKKVILEYTGRYIDHLELGSDIDAFVKLFTGVTEGIRAQAWNIPGTSYHHALKCRKKLLKILGDELEKRKQNKNNNARASEKISDLMDGLLLLKDKEGNHLSDEEVLDNVLSSIHVGHGAPTYLVAWSIYFLAKSPHVLQKLREENMDMSRKKSGEHITYEDITKLKYTNKVVEETIRMANSSGFVFRTASNDIEFKGYIIPKGWKVIVWLRYLHTSPENFEDPLCFNPDRWDVRPRHGTYLPFGGGARSCPGSMLARVNLAVFLHYLSIGYKWELLNPNTTIQYLSHPHPVDGFEVSFRNI